MENFNFDKIAKISHLEFSEDEKQNFIKDMQEMLSLASSLCTIDKEQISETAFKNLVPLSSDTEIKTDCENLISHSNRKDGHFVKVPSSLE